MVNLQSVNFTNIATMKNEQFNGKTYEKHPVSEIPEDFICGHCIFYKGDGCNEALTTCLKEDVYFTELQEVTV